MNYLTLVAIAKDETRHLREWLVYHALLGVEAFIIYDNESATPIRETLAEYLRGGFLKVVEISGRNMQLAAYNHALREFGQSTRWMGFLDLDEYVVPQQTDDLRHFLVDYEAHAGLAVNWVTYGSGGHSKRPHGLMIENYTQRLPLTDIANYHVKSIVKPPLTLHATSPHSFAFLPPCCAVNPDGIPVSSAFSPLCVDKIRINHYFYRSREEFEEKIRRGRADTNAPEQQRRMDAFNHQMDLPQEEDASALRFLDRLKGHLKADNPDQDMDWPRRSIADSPEAYLTAFQDMTRLADVGRAELILREALTRFPDDATLIAVRASLLRLTGNPELALAEAHRSLSIRSTPQALQELSLLNRAAGRPELAAKVDAFQSFLTA